MPDNLLEEAAREAEARNKAGDLGFAADTVGTFTKIIA